MSRKAEARAPRYLEDFRVGERSSSATATLSDREIIEFAASFDPQPFHVDAKAARRTFFRGLVASGWHTAGLTMRLLVTAGPPIAGGFIGLSVDDLKWPRPVRPGDTLRVEREVLEATPSRTKPDRGAVRIRNVTLNQRGEVVQTMTATLLVRRRPVLS